MRSAMAKAEVGDDVYGEDPTVNKLQEKGAALMGKKEAIFLPSGSMSNLIALFLNCGRGNEVLAQKNSHIVHNEINSAATIAGVTVVPVEGEKGILSPMDLQSHLRAKSYDSPRIKMIEIENSHNKEGGTCYRQKHLKALSEFAAKNKFAVHMDGARIFNAALAVDMPVKKIASYADTVGFCLSKGLGAPVGSLLCGEAAFIDEARRIRKLLGGGMRQAGIIAAAGLYALDNNIERLAEDHRNAQTLARCLAELPWAFVDLDTVETNIVYFRTPAHNAQDIAAALKKQGVLCIAMGGHSIRMVTSLAVSSRDIDIAVEKLKKLNP
jgi:threonine aldolase